MDLYATIRLPESDESSERRLIHYTKLASAEFVEGNRDRCAQFLSKLKKGIDSLERFWLEDGSSMECDPSTGHPFPCDCFAHKLDQSLFFTRHVMRNVFIGKRYMCLYFFLF